MSTQLRIQASQGRSTKIGNTRSLLRFSDPPKSPTATSSSCDALESDGKPCKVILPLESNPWCIRHGKEVDELNVKWKEAQQQAERIQALNPDAAKQKVTKLRLAIDLRRQWIIKLERDARALADSVLMSNLARHPTPDIPGMTSSPVAERSDQSAKIMILQSPLDPRIPMTSVQSLPDDGTILVLKRFYSDFCADAKRRLYEIAPDLDDTTDQYRQDASRRLDGGTEILRAWFRIMVFNDSEAEALEHATRVSSIDEFLNGRHPSQIETYCDFFEKAWRPHAVQYLRVAICAQTFAAGETKTLSILGGIIPSTTEALRMTKPCWDILYRWFPTLLTPWTLASICQNFEDYITVCKLLMLGLYREQWFDPESLLFSSTTSVYLGFIPSRKGDFTSIPTFSDERDSVFQFESRNYVTGQMAIGDPLTENLLDELRKRTERLLLVVYEGTNADATVYPSEDDVFIRRRRSAKTRDQLENAEWSTMITLEDVKNDLRLRKTSMYDPKVVDSWQFIIIDKQPGLPFTLFEVISDALLMLVGDPSPRQLAKNVIRHVIPPAVQEIFLDESRIDSPPEMKFPPPPEVQYEGNRQRCWQTERQVLLAHQSKAENGLTRDMKRFARRVIDDMEKCGVVSLATEFERPQTRAVVIQGQDGGLDLYFPYEFGGLAPDSELTPSLTLPPRSCLLDFAKLFQEKHPTGIMAKGSIQTHYCAWPMPSIKRLGKSRLNFATWEGHIYHWNAMPFDRPWSERAWQYYLHHYINSKYPFIMCYLTTFVICAANKTDAEKAVATILDETEKRDWRVVLPSLKDWTTEIEELNLEKLFEGVRPM